MCIWLYKSASRPHSLPRVGTRISGDGEVPRPLLGSAGSWKPSSSLSFPSQHVCGTLSFTTWHSNQLGRWQGRDCPILQIKKLRLRMGNYPTHIGGS